MKICRAWLLLLYVYNGLLAKTTNAFVCLTPVAKSSNVELKSTLSANNAPRSRRSYYDGLEYGYEVPGSGRMRGSEQGFGSEFRYPNRYDSRWKSFNYYDYDLGRDDDYFSRPRRSYYGMNDVYAYDRDLYNSWNRRGRKLNDFDSRYPRYARYPAQDRYYGSSYYGNPWDGRYGRRGRKYYDYDDSYYERRPYNLFDVHHNDFYYDRDDYPRRGSSSDYDNRRYYDDTYDWDYDYEDGDYWYNRDSYNIRRRRYRSW
mmetsp:Transcript_29775/g.44020  ORF Transcript_29775/g.44020 Transcript_29775/m.44020 type:complete len:258 (-) Transcript_29775:2264-3037(-)